MILPILGIPKGFNPFGGSARAEPSPFPLPAFPPIAANLHLTVYIRFGIIIIGLKADCA
jgi:hypothetical protein